VRYVELTYCSYVVHGISNSRNGRPILGIGRNDVGRVSSCPCAIIKELYLSNLASPVLKVNVDNSVTTGSEGI
jgi:hypothetical protein